MGTLICEEDQHFWRVSDGCLWAVKLHKKDKKFHLKHLRNPSKKKQIKSDLSEVDTADSGNDVTRSCQESANADSLACVRHNKLSKISFQIIPDFRYFTIHFFRHFEPKKKKNRENYCGLKSLGTLQDGLKKLGATSPVLNCISHFNFLEGDQPKFSLKLR